MKSFFSRAGKAFLRLLWRHWAPVAIAILCLLALWTGYRMWCAGFPGAMTMLPRLITYLLLIIVGFLAKYAFKRWGKVAVAKGKEALRKQVAQEVVEQGREKRHIALQGHVQFLSSDRRPSTHWTRPNRL